MTENKLTRIKDKGASVVTPKSKSHLELQTAKSK